MAQDKKHMFSLNILPNPWLGGTFVNSPGCLSLTIRIILRKPLGSLDLGHENIHMARVEIAQTFRILDYEEYSQNLELSCTE